MNTIKNIFCALIRLKNWNRAFVIVASVTMAFFIMYVVDNFIKEPKIQDGHPYMEYIDKFIIIILILIPLSLVLNLSRIASSLEDIARNTKKKE